jgi:histidinol-phosphate/aromatic aminotransferase/cobyric acid decarboxylase-like protein/CTP:phosphocholine cytidylyltransferase-like protein
MQVRKERVMARSSPEKNDGGRQRTAVRKAIILAAGSGSRMQPFTDNLPKCLAPVNGTPILINALTHLCDAGILETVIVVGHCKEKVYELVGDHFRDMRIVYVESMDYASTNNIYSLWLAREHLCEDILLLESDIFFDRQLVDKMLSQEGDNHAAVARHQSWMSGTVASLDSSNNVQALLDTRHQAADFDYSKVYKTVNIYLLRREFLLRYFVPHIEAFIASGDVNDFYEVILHTAAYHRKYNMAAVFCDDAKWYEIDDDNDRVVAEYMFASQEKRYDFICSQHGSYWRYDFADHAYLYNLYFPPEEVVLYLKNNIHDLVLEYPAGQETFAGLIGTLISQPARRLVVGNGASELIKIIFGRLCQRPIIPVPSFNEYANAAPKGNVIEFGLKPPFFQLDVDEYAEKIIQSGADVAVVVTPNNPTSLAVPKSNLVRLIEKLTNHDCMLIIDESFIDFMRDSDQATLQSEIGEYQNLAIIKSMSKSYGIGGLRIGYLLTANSRFAEAVRRETHIWNINGFADAFLRLVPRYRREFVRSCELVRADCDELYERLCSLPDLTVYGPDANFVFCRLPDSAPSGPEVTRRLFIEHNMLIKHCAGKTMPEPDRYLRIASRTGPENRRLVQALMRVISIQGEEDEACLIRSKAL